MTERHLERAAPGSPVLVCTAPKGGKRRASGEAEKCEHAAPFRGFVTGPRRDTGRIVTRQYPMCEGHARGFAAKHGLQVPA